MLNLILFGPPGSGKGTQASLLKDKYNLQHLSTGDMLRSEISMETELGRMAQSFMDKGELVPDSVVISMIDKRLESSDSTGGIIFDGFPRTVPQAQALDGLLSSHSTSISIVVSIIVEEAELVKRLLLRGESSNRSDDQNEEVIQNRIKEYWKKTAPVAEYYNISKKLVEIEGVGSIDNIFQSICSIIETQGAHL